MYKDAGLVLHLTRLLHPFLWASLPMLGSAAGDDAIWNSNVFTLYALEQGILAAGRSLYARVVFAENASVDTCPTSNTCNGMVYCFGIF